MTSIERHDYRADEETLLAWIQEEGETQSSRKILPDDSSTQSLSEGYPADPEFQLRGGWTNPMIDAAMPLFGLAIRLRTLDNLPNIAEVHKQVYIQVTNAVDEMQQHTYEPAHLLAYSYALCLYLDEVVMGRPWGKNSCWSQRPLLSDLHQETWGGEKFFTVLSRMMQEPQRYQDVLEFMYLCLGLGLKGKYGIDPKGNEALQALILKLYKVIRELRGPVPEQLSDPLSNVAPRNFQMNKQWPWWSPLAISAIAMAGLYGYYSYRLHLVSTEVLHSLNGILQQ